MRSPSIIETVPIEDAIIRREFLKRVAKTSLGLSLVGALNAEIPTLGKESRRLHAGVAKQKVTPPLSIPYLTSSGNGTCKEFEGLHDDLFARALVLDDGKTSLAILAVDSIGYDNSILGKDRDFTAELRKRISHQTGLDQSAIMLTATHAHSTPETIGLTNFTEVPGVSDWVENHLNELTETVIAAWKNRVSVRARFGKTAVGGIARNRRIYLKSKTLSRYGPVPSEDKVGVPWFLDEDLSLLAFETEAGALHSVLMNYTAHPVVTMLLPAISADYPGAAVAYVEQAFSGTVCLFTQGAAGNINSVSVTTSYDDASVLGEKLGKATVSEITDRKLNPIADISLRFRSKTVHLEPRDCPKLREAEKISAADPSPKNLRLLRLARKIALGPMRAEIQMMSIGPVKWVSLPGEPFVENGLALKKKGASFVCGYTNGWLGYFPIHRAYDEGGYEVDIGTWSRVAPGSAEILEATAMRLL